MIILANKLCKQRWCLTYREKSFVDGLAYCFEYKQVAAKSMNVSAGSNRLLKRSNNQQAVWRGFVLKELFRGIALQPYTEI